MVKRRKQIQPRFGVEKAFGQVIRQIREEELEISQAELEKRTGLDRTFISDLERGIQGPGIRTLLRIARGLKTPPGDLVRRTTESPLFVFPTGSLVPLLAELVSPLQDSMSLTIKKLALQSNRYKLR